MLFEFSLWKKNIPIIESKQNISIKTQKFKKKLFSAVENVLLRFSDISNNFNFFFCNSIYIIEYFKLLNVIIKNWNEEKKHKKTIIDNISVPKKQNTIIIV